MAKTLRIKTHNTVRGTIKALGGAAAVAKEAGISMQAVCNWMLDDSIPAGYHLAFYLRLEARGERVSPAVFGLDSAGWPLKSRRAA